MNYTQEILSLSERDFATADFKSICKTYARILESENYNDVHAVIKSFLLDVNESTIEKEDKMVVESHFKFILLDDLGLTKTYNEIMEKYSLKDDIIYKERLAEVKNLVNEKTDYLNIDRVIDIYKSLTNEEVVVEQIALLEEFRDRTAEDRKIALMINYLENTKAVTSYRKAYDVALKALRNYNLNQNADTRAEAMESLRDLSYDNTIKEFMNYLSALNFSDSSYGLHHDMKGSLATDRVVAGGYLEKFIFGEEKHGLGKIVIESINQADEISKQVGIRSALRLLLERLAEEELNPTELKVYERFDEAYSTWDLGLNEAVKNLKKSSVISKLPDFKRVYNLVVENTAAGNPDRNIIHESFNILSNFNFDTDVVSELSKIKNNFENSKERIIVENVLDYLDKNNILGINESLKNDLNEYLKTKSLRLKNHIIENYNKTTFDPNIKTFLSSFAGIQNNGILNSNPNDFTIKKVYSIFESVDGKDHFVVNDNYIIRDKNSISVVTEEEISPKVLEFSDLMKFFNFKVINENTLRGNIFDKGVKIEFDSISGEPSLYLNEEQIKENNIDSLKFVYGSKGLGNELRAILRLYENISLLTEMDFIQTIEYKKDPKIKTTLFNLDGSFVINLVNENIKLNKFSKTAKYTTLKNTLMEYMDFDISTSFLNELKIEKDKVDQLKEQAFEKFNEITDAESKLEKLKEHFESLSLTADLKKESVLILESLEKELEKMKKEYREILEITTKVNS